MNFIWTWLVQASIYDVFGWVIFFTTTINQNIL